MGRSLISNLLLVVITLVLGSAAIRAQTHSGRATGINAGVTSAGGSTTTTVAGDTCPLPGVGGTITTTVPSSSIPGVGTTGSITSTTSGNMNSSQSSTTVNNVFLTLASGVTVRANTVTAETQCTCCPGTTTAGCVGQVSISGLDVRDAAGAPVAITVTGNANQIVNLPGGGTLVINEQINGGGSITVNALHLNVTSGGVTNNIIVAQAHSDLTCITSGPTPADVSVSGRVATAAGVPIYRATVTLTDPSGAQKISRTNQLGGFNFTGVTVGQSYILQATHNFYTFQPRVVIVNDEMLDILLSPNNK